MDRQEKLTNVPEKPGAPELGKSVKIPSAPLQDEPDHGPAFQPTPTDNAQTSAPEASEPEVTPYESSEAERKAQAEYLKNLRESEDPKSRKLRTVFLVLLVLLLLVVVGVLGYLWWSLRANDGSAKIADEVNNPKQTTTQTQQTQQKPGNNQSSAGTEDYTSIDLGLSISYPSDWTQAEKNGTLTITSPAVELTDADGEPTQGNIILTVRGDQTTLPEFDDGSAVAVLASEKLKYAKPSAIQRASTYVSYLQFASTTTKGGLDGIYVTGDSGYTYAQTVPKGDIARVDPKISVSFVSCDDAACADGSTTRPLVISSSAWEESSHKKTVDDMLASIVLN